MFDVIAIGEVLVELATDRPFAHGVPARLGVSGDALNVAAAAAAAGARTALVAVLPDDEIGDAIAERVRALGVSDVLLVRRPGQQGVYLVHGDPSGERQFAYARGGSVGSTLSPGDLPLDQIAAAGVVVASGISGAISASARAALTTAARHAARFAYDPNLRPRLTTTAAAAGLLDELLPDIWLVTPSHPLETRELLGAATADAAAARLREAGAEIVVVTCGADGVLLRVGADAHRIASIPAPAVVDQTGAGDAFLGTFVARIARGDEVGRAAVRAAAAASLAVSVRGGADRVAALDEVDAHARTAAAWNG
ncbi:PfkB family carbohydrate kinase [Microbacterium sp. 18062]|uniref:PfkB family carbohydrate kinase n=1 Tax=Microbacterium sp. 18062 TaxID=2681410 RepID=UPI00135CCB34|nr:PfkB family carbohydrate kinase [Microbacterium sp. 18062]